MRVSVAEKIVKVRGLRSRLQRDQIHFCGGLEARLACFILFFMKGILYTLLCVCVCVHMTDAYSVKHITYRWEDGPRKSVSYNREMQLPQFEIKGFRVVTKLENTSTGTVEHCQN